MSIHVTVNADPVSIRRGGLLFSDLEQIKQYERGRRRRLRLEQVRQQSKNIASKILEQTKNISRKELNNLETNEDSKLKRMHEQKIMEIQRRYQEDMEDIGLAHESAKSQPDPTTILHEKKLKNQQIAQERGKDATKRLKEKSKPNEPTKHQRLRQVREIEDLRSTMIANLPSKEPQAPQSPKPKKKLRKKFKKNKLPRVHVEVNHGDQNPIDNSPTEVPCYSKCHREVDYNPNDYQNNFINSSNSSLNSLISDDSSYFSDRPTPTLSACISDNLSSAAPPALATSSAVESGTPSAASVASKNPVAHSEIKIYDHSTRLRNVYTHPEGLVERENLKTTPNANEMARKITQIETNDLNDKINRELIATRRGQDAILRDKVRRDYENLMKNLDNLSRDERKLKASNINSVCINADKFRRKNFNDARQEKINRAFENANINKNIQTNSEAIITIKPQKSACQKNDDDDDDNFVIEAEISGNSEGESREEQLLDMLKKVERQKRLLLQEFGTTLPNDIFSATMTPLFINESHQQAEKPSKQNQVEPPSPEIKVINMSRDKKSPKPKKPRKYRKNQSSTTEIAVQTLEDTEKNGRDKSIQVELPAEVPKEPAIDDANKSVIPEHIEPVVTIITHSDTSSNDSMNGIVINFGRNKVQVSPKKLKHTSLSSSESRSPKEKSKTSSAPTSRASTPEYQDSDETQISTDNLNNNSNNITESPVNKINKSIGTDNSGEQMNHQNKPYVLPRRRIKYKEVSDTSTSYASLPKVRNLNDEVSITSILELVDSSTNETIRMRNNVSPVSTPETPSPRTMRVASNLPNIDKLTRILKFDDVDDSSKNQRRVVRKIPIYLEKNESCTCPSPGSIQPATIDAAAAAADDDYNDDDHLDALKRDEELQNSCAEKIASLEAMIDKIRDEKRGIDLSMFAPSDDTSLMQLPSPKLSSANEGFHKLLHDLQIIHNRLADTLIESENRIKVQANQSKENIERAKLSEGREGRAKPRVISNERVHFDVEHYLIRKDNFNYASGGENSVEKLSREILEQSKSVKRGKESERVEGEDDWGGGEERRSSGFAPILGDIQEISSRTSIPVDGGYRVDPTSGRQLPTIDELDTTGPANQSSPTNQSPPKNPRPPQKSPQTQKTPTEKNHKSTSPLSQSQPNPNQQPENGENLSIEKSVISPDSFLTYYSTRNIGAGDFFDKINIKTALASYETKIKCDKTSTSSNSLSRFSGISKITSTSTSTSSAGSSSTDVTASPLQTIEVELKNLGLSSLIPIAKKTRKASALCSSSNSDTTLTINKRTKSSMKKLHDGNSWALLDFSDVSSISIREASKSTEKTVLMKARTSTPNIQNFYYSDKSNLPTTSNDTTEGKSGLDYSDSLVAKTLAIH